MSDRRQDQIKFLTKAYEQASAQRDELLAQQSLWIKSQREWQGLTSAERKVLWLAADTKMEFAELLEAKLKEKNT